MSNWPIFKAFNNIVQSKISKNHNTFQGRIASINKSNLTANVIVRKQSSTGTAYPTADTGLTSFSPSGSVELNVPDASAFKASTFVVISDSNPGKIEKVYISGIIDDSANKIHKLIISSPTQYDHQIRTRIIGINSSILGENTLSQNASKGSTVISLNDASFVPDPANLISTIKRKTFLKILKNDEVVIDSVTVLQKSGNQLTITPSLSYNFKSGDRVIASTLPDVDFDSEDEILIENVPIQPNGTDYSYAVVNQPVLLAAIEGNKNDLVVVGPASAMNVNDINQVNFDSKRFSVVIESIEEYTSDLVKQYDAYNNLIPDVLIRNYDLSKSKDVRELEDLESARKFKVNIGIRVPYEFLTSNSDNQNWMYAIACGTEVDPPLDSSGQPVLTLDTGGTGFSGFNVQGLPLANFFYGLEDWKRFSEVKNAQGLLDLGASRYTGHSVNSPASKIDLAPKTFNPVIENPSSDDRDVGANANSNKKAPFVYLKTFVIFNYKAPSHFYDEQGSTNDMAHKKLKSKNGTDLNFSFKVCAGRMSYLSQGKPDPIMPNIANYKITFKKKGPYRIDSNAEYPPRMNQTPSSGEGTPNPGTNITGSYRGEVGWDLQSTASFDLSDGIKWEMLQGESTFLLNNSTGNESFYRVYMGDKILDLHIFTTGGIYEYTPIGVMHILNIKNVRYVQLGGSMYPPPPYMNDFFTQKTIKAGTKISRLTSWLTSEWVEVGEDIILTPESPYKMFPEGGFGYDVSVIGGSLKIINKVSSLSSFTLKASAFEEFLKSWTGMWNWVAGKYKNRENAIKKYKFGGFKYLDNFEDDVVVMLTELKESRTKNFNPDKIMHQTSVMDRIPSTRMPDFFRVNISLSLRRYSTEFRYDHFNRCTQFYRNNDESPWYYNLFGDDNSYNDEESSQVDEISPGNFLIGIGNKTNRNVMQFFHDKNMMFYSDDIDSNNMNEKSITYTANETTDTVGFHSWDYATTPTPYWQIVYPSARGQLIDIFGKYEGLSVQNRGINTTQCKVGTHCLINTTGDWSKGDTKVIFRFNLSPDAIWHNYTNVDESSPEWGRRFNEGTIRIVIQPVYSINGKFKIGNSSVFFADASNGKSFADLDAGCYQASIERIT